MVGVCGRECMERRLGDEPFTLTRCHSCWLLQLYKACEGWKSICGQAYKLKGIKEKFSVFLLFLKLCFSFTVTLFLGMMLADPVVMGEGDSIINKYIYNSLLY